MLLRNPRNDIASHMQARILELYPPHTVYGKGLADELDVAVVPRYNEPLE